jgi:hypothetical protein
VLPVGGVHVDGDDPGPAGPGGHEPDRPAAERERGAVRRLDPNPGPRASRSVAVRTAAAWSSAAKPTWRSSAHRFPATPGYRPVFMVVTLSSLVMARS